MDKERKIESRQIERERERMTPRECREGEEEGQEMLRVWANIISLLNCLYSTIGGYLETPKGIES